MDATPAEGAEGKYDTEEGQATGGDANVDEEEVGVSFGSFFLRRRFGGGGADVASL